MMTESGKLRFREKLSYGLGDFASCLYWVAFGNFLFKFYTDVFGITAAVASAMDQRLGRRFARQSGGGATGVEAWVMFGSVEAALQEGRNGQTGCRPPARPGHVNC